MKLQFLCPAVLVAAVHGGSIGQSVTPVQKAIEMLKGMLSKAETGVHEEQKQYAAFKQFCDDATTEKQELIQKADEKIESLQAHILKYDSEVERLGNEIVGHQGDIAGWANDTEAAHVVRAQENEDYNLMHQNYSESISAIAKATAALKKQAFDRPGTSSALVQSLVKNGHVPVAAGRAMQAFLERDSEEPEVDLTPSFAAPPEAHAYEARSHSVIDILEELAGKFRDEVYALEKEEMQRKHAYETLVQDLRGSMDAGKASIESKTKNQAKNKELSADANSDLQDTSTTREDDNTYLTDLVATCQSKTTDYESRQLLRKDEMTALSKAIEILTGNTVSGAAEKHLPAALIRKNASSLAQVRTSGSPKTQAAVAAAAAYLQSASKRLGSRSLAALAVRVQEDPFAKVKQLIQELIDRLNDQATEEAEHKGWCDTELATNLLTRNTKTEEVEMLMTQIDGLEADIATLTKDIAELSTAVAELEKNVAEATEMRTTEKAENGKTVQEATDAQTAMSEAISTLKDFYDTASSATALVQGKIYASAYKALKQQPPIFDSAYKGLQDESGGVIGMLQVIQSDFARLESDTATAEEAAQEQYDTFMEASNTDLAQKKSDIKHKTTEKQNNEMDLVTAQGDLELAGNELSAAQAMFDKLKPACVDSGVTFEDRVGRREEEIQSLQEALSILNGEDAAVIQGVLVKGQSGGSQLRSDTSGLDYAK